jgi:oligopeptide/dipeptide ABC transporter ATP-binding protein
MKKNLAPLQKAEPVQAEVEAAVKEMKAAVIKCLDPLEVTKDSLTHTFDSSIDYAVDLYFGGFQRNAKEEKRFARSSAKHQRIIDKGKTPDWEVIPMNLVNLDAARQDMADTVNEQIAHFEAQLAANENADFSARTLEIVDYLKEQTENSAYRLTNHVARERAIKLMEGVGIDNPRRRFRQYPFEFSGGMRQRIVIAIALTADPDILICDEPTTALDVTIQAQILELINNLKKQRNLSVIFITHDLGVVANMADRIAVMYAGQIVEYGTAKDVFYEPAHPYTWALLASVPDLDTKEKLESIPGTPPNMIYPPKGDAFAERNANALEIDFEMQPPMFQISDTHYAATWLLDPRAPKIEMPKVILERLARIQARNAAKKAEMTKEEG